MEKIKKLFVKSDMVTSLQKDFPSPLKTFKISPNNEEIQEYILETNQNVNYEYLSAKKYQYLIDVAALPDPNEDLNESIQSKHGPKKVLPQKGPNSFLAFLGNLV